MFGRYKLPKDGREEQPNDFQFHFKHPAARAHFHVLTSPPNHLISVEAEEIANSTFDAYNKGGFRVISDTSVQLLIALARETSPEDMSEDEYAALQEALESRLY